MAPQVIEGITKAWTSEREISVELNNLPTASDWVNWLSKEGSYVAWRYGYGEAKSPNKLTYPDYSGWFLQEEKRIENTDFGVLFKFVEVRDQKGHITIEKYDVNAESLWLAINRIVANQRLAIIRSGNCKFEGHEWLDFVDHGLMPERYIFK
ncbi:hypothetical protein [Desulfosporosinus sp.]|uniref:hypothetical protein n=1 Tax=Desulfosporosinus sp. TaxID=157907 RepID=UPI0025C236E4|nr:hypothetical protein [Desulfosporosinus sp.]MBC2725089.1 hypothetical protein [Desulfosporosinus sp.]